MKRMVWTLATVAFVNAICAATPSLSDDRLPRAQEPAGSLTTTLGDQVACAVDGMKMPLATDTPSAEYRGKRYYFCTEEEKQTFLKDPEYYTKH
jgi:YHS domain-containing protein